MHSAKPPFSRVDIVPAAWIPPEPVEWLWAGWLAAGKVNILGGQAATGKTTTALSWAAILSRGSVGGYQWPDGSYAPCGNVVVWTGEDGVSDTIIPRLMAMGADRDRVHILRGMLECDRSRPFNFEADLPMLSEAIEQIGNVRLVIVDSIVQAISGDARKNSEVRRGLEPLGTLAETHNCAILGITHVSKGSKNKDPLERITGSLAFGAVPRVVLIAAKDERPNDERTSVPCVLVRAKTTHANPNGGFEYQIRSAVVQHEGRAIEASRVDWNSVSLDGSAKEILQRVQHDAGSTSDSATGTAARFLKNILAAGPLPCAEVEALAVKAAIAPSALKRARKQLGIVSRRPMGYTGNILSLPTIAASNESWHSLQSHGISSYSVGSSTSEIPPWTQSSHKWFQQTNAAPLSPDDPPAPPDRPASSERVERPNSDFEDTNSKYAPDQTEQSLYDLVATHFGHPVSSDTPNATSSEDNCAKTTLDELNNQDTTWPENNIRIIPEVFDYLVSRCRIRLNSAAQMADEEFDDLAARIVAEEVDAMVPDDDEMAAYYRAKINKLPWWNAL